MCKATVLLTTVSTWNQRRKILQASEWAAACFCLEHLKQQVIDGPRWTGCGGKQSGPKIIAKKQWSGFYSKL